MHRQPHACTSLCLTLTPPSPACACLVRPPHRFHRMGGECNYLLRVNPTTYRLEFVPEEAWQTPEMLSWDEDDIKVRDRVEGGCGVEGR